MDARVEDFSSRIIVIRSDRCTSASSECEASFVLPKPIVPAHGSVAMIQLLKFQEFSAQLLLDQRVHRQAHYYGGYVHARAWKLQPKHDAGLPALHSTDFSGVCGQTIQV